MKPTRPRPCLRCSVPTENGLECCLAWGGVRYAGVLCTGCVSLRFELMTRDSRTPVRDFFAGSEFEKAHGKIEE